MRALTGLILAVLITIGFLGTLIGPELSGGAAALGSSGPNAYSRSATGYHAFVALARQSGFDITLSRQDPLASPDDGALLIINDPSDPDWLATLLARPGTRPLLIVLPKRHAVPDRETRGHDARVRLIDPADVEALVQALDPAARIRRTPPTAPLSFDAMTARLSDPQLITGPSFEPVIGTGKGMLLARWTGGIAPVHLLADPDLIATHGLARGDNAGLALAILARLADGEGPIRFDVAMHGFADSRNLFLAALRPPFIILTLQLALALILAAWAGWARFGRARPDAAGLASGNQLLIENGARLLTAARQTGVILDHYRAALRRRLATGLRLPANLPAEVLDRAIDRLTPAGRQAERWSELSARIDRIDANLPQPALMALARSLHHAHAAILAPRNRKDDLHDR